MIIVLTFIVGFAFGILAYLIFKEGDEVLFKKKEEEVDADGYTRPEKTSHWRIVRYRNGKFDCVWKSGIFDKRVADKICKKLNDPNAGNEHYYGTYVVEE